MKIGYACIFKKQQYESLDQQISLLKKSGCEEIYSEVINISSSKRKELTKLLNRIQTHDIFVITAIDRLGRSLKDLIAIINNLQEKGVKFQSLKEQMDTNTDTGILMFNMIRSIAEFERKLINRRIYNGVKSSKEQGKYKERNYRVNEDIRKEYVDMLNSGKYPAAHIARMAKISRQTLYNWKASFKG